MPKQVYVYPGNINDADTIEGVRQVLEPAVDKVFFFDDTAGTYVNVNNPTEQLDVDTYVLDTNTDLNVGYLGENILHITGPLPVDSSGNEFIPIISSPSTNNLRASIVKRLVPSLSGDPIVETVHSSTVSGGNSGTYDPILTKILWDDANETIFIAIKDGLVSNSNSSIRNYYARAAVILARYDKSLNTVSIVQNINETDSFLRKHPIGATYYYYDAATDTYTFYQPVIGSSGIIEIRKIVATKTTLTSTFEPVNLSATTFVPEFPDSITDSNVHKIIHRSGLLTAKRWVEITAPLESLGTNQTIGLYSAPNLSSETSVSNILENLDLAFLTGQFSFDSVSSTWTFTVSSEFTVESVAKKFSKGETYFPTNKKALQPGILLDVPGSGLTEYTILDLVFLEKIHDVSLPEHLSGEYIPVRRTLMRPNIARSVHEYSYDSTGKVVVTKWDGFFAASAVFSTIDRFQIDTPQNPEILLYRKDNRTVYPLVKPINSTVLNDYVPLSSKYIFDISQASTKGNRYFLKSHVINSRQLLYAQQPIDTLSGLNNVLILVEDYQPYAIPKVSGAIKYYVDQSPALNYSSGGTLTSVYHRDANGLEFLAVWIRSGSTMHSVFTLFFERNLDPASIYKYVYDNTDVDNIFVLSNAVLNNTTSLRFFSPLGSALSINTSTDPNDWIYPVSPSGSINLKLGGISTYYTPRGELVYFNSALGELVTTKKGDVNSIVLSPYVAYQSPIYYLGGLYAQYYIQQLITSGSALTTVFNSYKLQTVVDFWGADFEDTIELTIGTNTYKYVVVGKFSQDYENYLVLLLEDIV